MNSIEKKTQTDFKSLIHKENPPFSCRTQETVITLKSKLYQQFFHKSD